VLFYIDLTIQGREHHCWVFVKWQFTNVLLQLQFIPR